MNTLPCRRRWFPVREWLSVSLMLLSVCLICPRTLLAGASDSEHLQKAFQKAFTNPSELKGSGMFEALGYSPEQIRQMLEVTPKPATLTVEMKPGTEPGEFEDILVHATQVRYYGLMIDHASFSFPRSLLDEEALASDTLKFVRLDEVAIETRVSEADLLKVFPFTTRSRQLSDLKLKFTPKEVNLRGRMRQSMLVVAFSLNGLPEIVKEKRIDFRCSRLVLNGVPLPRSAIRMMFNHVNPVFDTEKTWLNLRLEKISMETGFVFCRARLSGPAMPMEATR